MRLITLSRSSVRFMAAFAIWVGVTLGMSERGWAQDGAATSTPAPNPSAVAAPVTSIAPSVSSAESAPRRAEEGETTNYRIRAGDTLELKVYQEDDLNTKVRVDEEGGIVLPLIGRVAVLGQTSEAVRRIVTERYHIEYVINPQVTLAVVDFAPRRYSVMGQVVKPGVYEIPSREKVNLLQAIAMAGGYTKIADPSKVRIRRVTDKGEEILRFNAKTLATGTASEIPTIQGDDNITIGESAF